MSVQTAFFRRQPQRGWLVMEHGSIAILAVIVIVIVAGLVWALTHRSTVVKMVMHQRYLSGFAGTAPHGCCNTPRYRCRGEQRSSLSLSGLRQQRAVEDIGKMVKIITGHHRSSVNKPDQNPRKRLFVPEHLGLRARR